MATTISVQGTISQRLGIVCALAMAASVLAGDEKSLERVSSYHMNASSRMSAEAEAEALALIPALVELGDTIIGQLDFIYEQMLANRIPLTRLPNEPFASAGEVFSRALVQLKDMRGTGKLGPKGDALLVNLAECRHKADRNANLMRQMIATPKPYVSPIDRAGLSAMSRLGREAASSFSA